MDPNSYIQAIEPSPSSEAHGSTSRRSQDDELVKKQRSFPLEIPILLLFLSWNLTGTVFQYEILYQTCTVALQFNETQCGQLGQGDNNEDLQVSYAIQPSRHLNAFF